MASRDTALEEIAQHLDISPSDFRRAQERYGAVRSWLENGDYSSGAVPDIYLQGSFRLGTVVRPYRDGEDADFDIDQVCELTRRREPVVAETLKHDIGDRLKDNADYSRMLDEEGQRCWTLLYASEENRPGFHLDVLPAVTDTDGRPGEIDITDKNARVYSWSSSNPKGYYLWFKSRNAFSDDYAIEQQSEIFAAHRGLYRNVDEVPKQLVRTPLQRSVQIMKRHRDVHFAERTHKPISIIITTICTQLFENAGILETIRHFVRYVHKRHSVVMSGNEPERDGVLDYVGGEWLIPNPADAGKPDHAVENFADKWNRDARLPKAFFDWAYQLGRDLRGFEKSGLSDDLALGIKRFGDGPAYPSIQIRALREHTDVGSCDFTNQLLDLIHLGIEGRADWRTIEELAVRNVEETPKGESKDIAWINYYQTTLHQGRRLSDAANERTRRILRERAEKPNFVFCCNLLLGTATRAMLQACIDYCIRSDGYAGDVMSWPIVRLAALIHT